MAKSAVEAELGCGLMGGIFQSFLSRKSSVPSLPTNSSRHLSKLSNTQDSNRRRAETLLMDSSNSAKPPLKPEERNSIKPALVHPRPSISHNQNQSRRPSDATRSSTSSSSNISSLTTKVSNGHDLVNLNRLRREVSGISTDLNKFIDEKEQSNGNKALVRATSGNIMLLGHLGNLKQSTGTTLNSTAAQKKNSISSHKFGNGKAGSNGIGNIVRTPSYEGNWDRKSTSKIDPEVLKSMGNDEYKKGRFEEALALYEQAIALDPNKAAYHSNKAATLTGLGRIIEAVFACREAVKIDPYFQRAHHRLAKLYLRLGEAGEALCHYKYSCPKADSDYILEAQALQTHLSKCTEAQKLRDWNTLLKETQWAISSGVDSAPQLYALQAEALLKLHRHQEAYALFKKGPNFDIKSCIDYFGPENSAYLLIIQAQVYMAMGRLEDSVASAQNAARLDSTSREVSAEFRRIREVTLARSKGNQLFKASKFSEACAAYSEGLEQDPYNSLLLCNRAVCRSKLGQFEKAVEDCNAALDVRPSYSKARLRRAECNGKLERWEASIEDYEMVIRETPGDEEVGRALFEAQVQLKKERGEDTSDMKFGSNMVFVNSNERFRHFTTSPGMSVVLFCNKTCHHQVLQLLQQVCERFPSVNFLKMEIEDHPYLAKSEGVTYIPAFKIYKNGSRVKEIAGNNRKLLEDAVKLYSSS